MTHEIAAALPPVVLNGRPIFLLYRCNATYSLAETGNVSDPILDFHSGTFEEILELMMLMSSDLEVCIFATVIVFM